MVADPDLRKKLAKEGRLWLLSLLCAVPGAVAVALTDRISIGIAVFAACLLVFGTALVLYERRYRQ
jgi:hypothetical protein